MRLVSKSIFFQRLGAIKRTSFRHLLYTKIWPHFSVHNIYCIPQYGCISLYTALTVYHSIAAFLCTQHLLYTTVLLHFSVHIAFTVYHSIAAFLWAWVCLCQCRKCGKMSYLFFLKFKQVAISAGNNK